MLPAAFSITRPILLHIVCLLSTHTDSLTKMEGHTIAISLKSIEKVGDFVGKNEEAERGKPRKGKGGKEKMGQNAPEYDKG